MQHLRMIIVDSVAAVVSPFLGGQQIHGNNILLEINLFWLKHYAGRQWAKSKCQRAALVPKLFSLDY